MRVIMPTEKNNINKTGCYRFARKNNEVLLFWIIGKTRFILKGIGYASIFYSVSIRYQKVPNISFGKARVRDIQSTYEAR